MCNYLRKAPEGIQDYTIRTDTRINERGVYIRQSFLKKYCFIANIAYIKNTLELTQHKYGHPIYNFDGMGNNHSSKG